MEGKVYTGRGGSWAAQSFSECLLHLLLCGCCYPWIQELWGFLTSWQISEDDKYCACTLFPVHTGSSEVAKERGRMGGLIDDIMPAWKNWIFKWVVIHFDTSCAWKINNWETKTVGPASSCAQGWAKEECGCWESKCLARKGPGAEVNPWQYLPDARLRGKPPNTLLISISMIFTGL